VAVQDDERERELVRLFNLTWDAAHQRSGVDAVLDIKVGDRKRRIEVEVKSSTGTTVSTARDVSMEHILKWRSKLFVIGFYSRSAGRPELQKSLCLTPIDMEPWISSIENKILIDFTLAGRASMKLEMDDLFDVCGEQHTYSRDDAKRLHKNQWSAEQYDSALDVTIDGHRRISQVRMLEILQLRAKYIAERGATLNNPHITSSFLSRFYGSDREITGNWAERIRAIATAFVEDYPDHSASQLI